jgi:hypothetical protein
MQAGREGPFLPEIIYKFELTIMSIFQALGWYFLKTFFILSVVTFV